MVKQFSSDRFLFFSGMLLFMLVTAAALFLQEPIWMLAPFVILIAIIFIQYPELLFYTLVASIPWSIEYSVSSGLSTDLPDEPLMVLLSLAAILTIIYKRKELLRRNKYSVLLIVLAIQLVWMMVAVGFSTNHLVSIKYILAKGWYLGAFVIAPLLLIDNEKKLKNIAIVFLCSLLAVVIISIVRHAQFNFSFASINDSLYPFFRNHVNYSALLICGLPVVVALYANTENRSYRRVLIAAFIILFMATIFAYARGAWLAIIAGGVAYWLLRKRWLVYTYIFVLLAGIISVSYLSSSDRYLKFAHDYESTIFHENFEEHLIATIELKDVSSAERFNRWIGGVRMIKDYWATGSGPSTFYPLYKQYTVPAFKTWVSRNEERSTVHNYYLLTIIEQGIMGFILLMLLIGFALYKAQSIFHSSSDRFWKHTIAVATVIFSMVLTVNLLSDLIEADKIGSMFYLCLAVIIIAELKHKRQSDPTPDVHSIS